MAHATIPPWRTAVLDLLGDGEWHDREELIAVAVPLIPPGRAYRDAERRRQAKRDAPGPRAGDADDSAVIAVGARSIARATLAAIVRNGHARLDAGRYQLLTGAKT